MRTSLHLEMKAGLQETLVFALVKSIEPCRAMGYVLLHFIGLLQQVHGEHPLAEIAFIQSALQHQFVQVLKFGECEFLGQKLESDGLIPQLPAQTFERRMQDVGMIESEARDIMNAEPT